MTASDWVGVAVVGAAGAVSVVASYRLVRDLAGRSPPVGGDAYWLVFQPYGLVVGLLLWAAGNPRGRPLARRSALVIAALPVIAVVFNLVGLGLYAALVALGLASDSWN